MLTLRDHQTGELFDPWSHLGPQRRTILEKSWAGVFREHLLQHLPVAELAHYFRDGFGRPSKDLHVALGALILQQLHDLTDAQTTEAVALNIAWHYALDIRHQADAYVCERTLRNYRRKVIDNNLDEVLFRQLTDRLIQVVGVDSTKQRLDSTAVRSAIRGLTRLGILVEATRKFLRELQRKIPEQYAVIEENLIRKYLERRGEGCFADTRPSESKRRLPESARDVYGLIQLFQHTEAASLDSFLLLNRIFDEQCEVVDDPNVPVVVRPPRKTDCDGIVSPADPDARYNKYRGSGYLVQIMETYIEDDNPEISSKPTTPDLITHVALDPMTMHDQDALEPALEDTEKRGVKPKTLLADSHYGSKECLKKGRRRDVEIISPAMTAKGKLQGRLTLEDFELDDQGCVQRCPAGEEPVKTSVSSKRIQVTFEPEVCGSCRFFEKCPATGAGRGAHRWQYIPDRVQQRERRWHNATNAFRDRYRWRAGVEATMSRLKHQMGMARLRVRGMASVTYVTMLRALGLNILRVTAYRAALGVA